MSVARLIDDYRAALAVDDKQALNEALTRLTETPLSFDEWEIMRAFCEANGMYARLEVVTRRLLLEPTADLRPHQTLIRLLIRSNDLAEARRVAAAYRARYEATRENRWTIMELLSAAKDHRACLDVAERGLVEDPRNFAYRMMQCQSYWHLGHRFRARRILRGLRAARDSDPGRWLWHANVASGFGMKRESRSSLLKLVKLISTGRARVNANVVFALTAAGFDRESRDLLTAADPAHHQDPAELERMFDHARDRALYDVAARFAAEIEGREAGPRLLRKLRSFYADTRFLQAGL